MGLHNSQSLLHAHTCCCTLFDISSTMKLFYAALLLTCYCAASASALHGMEATDICGDPQTTSKMVDDPKMVLDMLRNLDSNKRAYQRIEDNAFLKDVESGKMTKDMMKQWIIQQAYSLESLMRSFAGAYNFFGTTFPNVSSREHFRICMDSTRYALEHLPSLGRKFDIADTKDLLKYDPNPVMLYYAGAISDGVMHCEHNSEIVAAMAVSVDAWWKVMQRMKKSLSTVSAYKAWGLTDDDLQAFDVWKNTEEMTRYFKSAESIIGEGLDRKVTICQLRRMLNNLNVGNMMWWEAVSFKPESIKPEPKYIRKMVGF